jgi:hypothetical protein
MAKGAQKPIKTSSAIIMFIIISTSIASITTALQNSVEIQVTGSIYYEPQGNSIVITDDVIGTNNLSLGFQLDWYSWIGFVNNAARQQLANDANFKLVRVFDFRKTDPRLMPCTHWDEATKTGTWDWTNVDSFVQAVYSVGAEPLFCLGWARDNVQNYIPPGMAVNPTTALPYPDSYAAYCRAWVEHFKNTGKPVKHYQIMNEPAAYFGWTPPSTTKLGYYVELWNAAARAMRQVTPDVMLSQDCITRKGVLEYWIQHGDDIDMLDFHKYDTFDYPSPYTDAELLAIAETRYFETGSTAWGVEDARQMWHDARGGWLPVINSESNINSAADQGTDPDIQTMIGATWTALVLRTGILKGVSYNVYFEFSSSKSWELDNKQSGGWGFGMINSDNTKPHYPYYVHHMIGNNLDVGDPILETRYASSDVRTLAWNHDQTLNILLICRVDQPRTVYLNGVQGQLNVLRIDNNVSSENPSIQSDIISANDPIFLDGYSVVLIQTAA